MATLDDVEARRLAEVEGLVTHLTSLTLVDEEGGAQEGLPATRKIPLPPKVDFAAALACAPTARAVRARATGRPMQYLESVPKSVCVKKKSPRRSAMHDAVERSFDIARQRRAEPKLSPTPAAPEPDQALLRLAALRRRIDWHAEAARLAEGDLAGLPRDVASVIDHAADDESVIQRAAALGITPVRLLIGILALDKAEPDRAAKRVVRAIFGRTVPSMALNLARTLDLVTDSARDAAQGSPA